MASKWFAVKLTKDTAPWAFWHGEPFKAVSSLELFGTVLCLMLFTRDNEATGKQTVSVTGLTDSMVASLVLGKGLTTSFPMCVIAMEAAAQMEHQQLDLQLRWVPRELNTEADALSNLRFTGFSASNRIEADLSSLPFRVLPRLIKAAEEISKTKSLALVSRSDTGTQRQRPRLKVAPAKRLRVAQPW